MKTKNRSVFVIGDSISIHYGPYLQEMISNTFEYNRKGGLEEALVDINNPVGSNAGHSTMIIDYLTEESAKNVKYDVLLINCGLHDIRVNRHSKKIEVTEEEYRSNLNQILNILKTMANKIVWVESTPVIDSLHNSKEDGSLRYNKDLKKYNEIANDIMSKNNVPIVPLYNFTKNLGAEEIYCDYVHYKNEVRKLQAAFISGFLHTV